MPEHIPIISGDYQSRSVIANAQRCVNLYADKNPEDSPFPFTFYPTPGLERLWSPLSPAPARGLFTLSNGDLYGVIGNGLYYIPPSFVPVLKGNLTTNVTPVSMRDNGSEALLVDGTTHALLVDLPARTAVAYADVNFLGADRVDYLDEFLVMNQPNTRNFYTTLLNTTTIDSTYIAAKSAGADNLIRAVCIERLIYLLGSVSSEVWGNAGAPAFPFEEVPGAFIQHGVVAPYSVATHDNVIYFVEQNKDGKGVIAKASQYGAQRISTPAIEAEIAKYPTLTDAIGFCYAMLGHVYYVVSFPSADKTWSFDLTHTPPMPHEWLWSDSNGIEHRHRASCAAYAYGVNVAGDWQNGDLYKLDPYRYNDFGGQIVRRRGFPHLVSKGRTVEHRQFQAEVEVGERTNPDYAITLRISRTRGKSWSQPIARLLGSKGDFLRVPQWRQLGLARDMVFELSWAFDAQCALNGGYSDYYPTDA